MRPGKTIHIFQVGQYSVKFSGNFDSGNLKNVIQIAPFQYGLEAALDSYEYPSTAKNFFHFFTEGFPEGPQLRLEFKKLGLLSCLKQDVYRYRPFKSADGQNYFRVEQQEVEIGWTGESPTLILKVIAKQSRIYYSFALPYSYNRYLNMIRDLPCSNEEMYIHKEVLCYSNNLNLVYAVSITSQHKCTQNDQKIGESTNTVLLPEKHIGPSKRSFDKPVILISSRVHPGQTPASWAVEGILKFLTSNEEDAKLLRKYFQVIIVPMLNPDGVEQGLYRLDTNGCNLNRYYLTGDNRQPSIYCMKHLIRHYHQTKRLLYYFDLHGHPSQKGSFLYGNALDQLAFQVETELFARLMSINCPTFEEKYCIFDRQQMNSKDRYDQFTKQGCARVFAFRTANILHSYTMQMGFHGLSDHNSPMLYSHQQYYQQGKSILVSVLVSCGLKPISQPSTLYSQRKQLALQICEKQERFRRQQRFLQQKKKNVNEIIEEQYWRPLNQCHFHQFKKLKIVCPQKRFKVHKSIHLPSFMSSDINEKKQKNQQSQDKGSVGQIFQQTKIKIQSNTIAFQFNKNHDSLHSTNATKTDLDSPIEKIPQRLIKLPPPRGLVKIQPVGFRQKYRSLRKCFIGERRISGREEEYIFSDNNIRTEAGKNSNTGIKRNKIHSLFIQAHQ